MNHKLLIIGGGKESILGIQKAESMGLEFWIADEDPFCAANEYWPERMIRASTKDWLGIVSGLEVLKWKPDGVITYAHDVASTVARLAQQFGCHGQNPGLVLALENKYSQYELLNRLCKVPETRMVTLSDEIARATYHWKSVVVKPVANCGSRGVILVDETVSPEWALRKAAQYDPNDRVLMQKYLPGPQYSVEVIVLEGKTHIVGISDRNYEFLWKYRPYIVENGGNCPAKLHQSTEDAIKWTVNRVIEGLGVTNGTVKFDLVNRNSHIYVLEVALRLSGGGYSSVQIPEAYGIDLLQVATQLALGQYVNPGDLRPSGPNHCPNRYIFPPGEVTCHADRLDMLYYTATTREEAVGVLEERVRLWEKDWRQSE